MELLLFSFLVSWALVNYTGADIAASWKGTESPRQKTRRQRMANQHQRQMHRARQGPTIRSALGTRIARALSEPKQPKPARDRSHRGPARRYFGGLWEDSWNSAAERRQRRRDQRGKGREAREGVGEDPPQRSERRVRPEPVFATAERTDRPSGDVPPRPENVPPRPEPSDPKPSGPSDPEDAEVVDTAAPETPQAGDHNRNGAHMGSPTAIEATDVWTAQAFADQMQKVAAEAASQCESALASLTGQGETAASAEIARMGEHFTAAAQGSASVKETTDRQAAAADAVHSTEGIGQDTHGSYLGLNGAGRH